MLPIMPLRMRNPFALPASTKFLTRFTASPPLDEVLGTAGTLVGNATVDTANSRLTLDGTGDWCTFPTRTAFDLAGDFTLEVHTDQAAAQVGGLIGRNDVSTGGSPRYVLYCDGGGRVDMYCDNISGVAVIGAASMFNGSEHHVAFCREGNTWRLYKDGVQVATVSNSGVIGTATKDLFIGTDPWAPTSRDILAHIGRVKISNTCLYPGGTTFTAPARTAI